MRLTAIRWAVHPAETGRIEQLPGVSKYVAPGIPEEGATLTHPYLVDPKTRQPCPLIVSQVMRGYPEPHLVTVVVSRQQ